MIYGLWRSAAGMMTAMHRQDVIANNLANTETTGFKRNLALTQERRLPAQELPMFQQYNDAFYNKLGGGTLLSPTATDQTQGMIEHTGSGYNAAIQGDGYFVVQKDGNKFLTRNGNFMLDSSGYLTLADGSYARVLSADLSPIQMDPIAPTEIGEGGQIIQFGVQVAKLGLRSAGDAELKKESQQLFSVTSTEVSALKEGKGTIEGGALEHSNVDPTTELTQLIENMRLMEANANILRYQDTALGRLVNDVAKVS